MANAQEPIHEERYYVLEFRQIGMDTQSWAARETRTMTTQSLSNTDSYAIVSELRNCEEYGKAARKWFDNVDINFYKERRNLMAHIRHVVTIVLFYRVFVRFVFGFSWGTSHYLENIEKRICLNGF
jgi:hypothetical protein